MAPHVAVVIPCYRVRDTIKGVIERIGPEVRTIICVDDACPEGSGHEVLDSVRDSRASVEFHSSNRGVGGAMVTGYVRALAAGAEIVVKVDGDGQMDPTLVPVMIRPIVEGRADYAKGNRFFSIEDVSDMPAARLLGNAVLSFVSKLSSGYWDVFDPTNGYTAVHANVLRHLPLQKLNHGYFFESDMLFRLNTLRAVVVDVPMRAIYGVGRSSLSIPRVALSFLLKHAVNLAKRVVYNYFLRDFSVASLELVVGLAAVLFGTAFGASQWLLSAQTGEPATAGTVMLAALPVLVGIWLLLGFLNYDISNVPRNPVHRLLA